MRLAKLVASSAVFVAFAAVGTAISVQLSGPAGAETPDLIESAQVQSEWDSAVGDLGLPWPPAPGKNPRPPAMFTPIDGEIHLFDRELLEEVVINVWRCSWIEQFESTSNSGERNSIIQLLDQAEELTGAQFEYMRARNDKISSEAKVSQTEHFEYELMFYCDPLLSRN